MFRSLSRLLPFSLLALCSLRGAILLDNTQVMEDRPDEESFQAIGQSWGRFLAFKTIQKPNALDSVSLVLTRDRYRFRTPALRNVALTGPWGHTGAYRRLEDVVLHHLQPESGLRSYDSEQALCLPWCRQKMMTGFVWMIPRLLSDERSH